MSLVPNTIEFMKGKAIDGGVISLDIMQKFNINANQAKAHLGYLCRTNRIIRMGRQINLDCISNQFTIYILKEEEEQWYM